MATKKTGRNRLKKRGNGGIVLLITILVLVAVVAAIYLYQHHGSRISEQGVRNQPSRAESTRAVLPPRSSGYANVSSVAQKHREGQEAAIHEGTAVGHPEMPTDRITVGKGQLAIIIDDMGTSMQEARSLAGIGVPLTFSIIPGLRSYREVASFAAASGIETMIHIPMQPKGWPQQRLEANGLLLSMDDAAITARLEGFIRDIPRAIGANNHMGSEFTEHDDKMRVVLGTLKAKGLFFIDSVTSPQTAGLRLAREMEIRTGRRNVFLDNEQNEGYIRGQLDQAVRHAKKTGAGIAICHPHPATIRTLAALLPGLERQGIILVPASRLVR